MKQEQKFDLSHFETLSESSNGTLIGGFSNAVAASSSTSIDVNLNVSKCGQTNNCSGGNCVSGCGTTTPKPPTGPGPVTV